MRRKKGNKSTYKITALVAIGVLVLVLGVYSVNAQFSLTDKIAQIAGQVLGQNLSEQIDIGEAENVNSLGAFAGPKIFSPFLEVNGSRTYYYSSVFKNSATSTVCSFKSPNATTTITHAGTNVVENTAGIALVLAHATNDFATTTVLSSDTREAGSQLNVVATSTKNTAAMSMEGLVSPNTYINTSLEAQTTATGTCSLILTTL